MKYFWFLFFSFLLFFSCGKKAVVVPEPEPIPQKYTIETIVVSGNGKISSSATEVLAGTGITITLQPDFGYSLPKSISVNNQNLDIISNLFSLTINENKKIAVTFPIDDIFKFVTSAGILVKDSIIIDGVKSPVSFRDEYLFDKNGAVSIFTAAANQTSIKKWDYDQKLVSITIGDELWNIEIMLKGIFIFKNGFGYYLVKK